MVALIDWSTFDDLGPIIGEIKVLVTLIMLKRIQDMELQKHHGLNELQMLLSWPRRISRFDELSNSLLV